MRKISGLILAATLSTLAWSYGGQVTGTPTGQSRTGTTNTVPVYKSNGQIGNGIITDNGTNVGIGNSSPATKLDVNGTITATGYTGPIAGATAITASTVTVSAGTGSKCFSVDDPTVIVNCNTHTVTFSGSTMTVLSTGKVGIGTASPATLLDVEGAAQFGAGVNKSTFSSIGALTLGGNLTVNANFTVLNTAANDKALAFTGAGSGYQYLDFLNTSGHGFFGVEGTAANSLQTGDAINSTNIGSVNNTNFHIGTNGAVRMTIDGTGNVGIHDTSPDADFEILSVASPTGYVLSVSSQSDAVGGMLSVLGNGNTGIGTANPASLLHVLGSAQFGNTVTVSSFSASGNLTVVGTANTSPAATFSPNLSSSTVSSALSGTFTGTTISACVSGSTVTLTLPTNVSQVAVSFNGAMSNDGLNNVIAVGFLVDGALTNGETTAKGITSAKEQVATDDNNMSFNVIVTGLSAATHNFCLAPRVSAGTGTIDSTNSNALFSVYMLP